MRRENSATSGHPWYYYIPLSVLGAMLPAKQQGVGSIPIGGSIY
jgi:hypothetical protein